MVLPGLVLSLVTIIISWHLTTQWDLSTTVPVITGASTRRKVRKVRGNAICYGQTDHAGGDKYSPDFFGLETWNRAPVVRTWGDRCR